MPLARLASMVALIVIVTLPAAAMLPFQVTVLLPMVATAVGLLAAAEIKVRPAGSTSMNSLPELSAWALVPLLLSTIV